jgi:hypothetical protein
VNNWLLEAKETQISTKESSCFFIFKIKPTNLQKQNTKDNNFLIHFNIPEKHIEQYESHINSLEKELDFLREMLKKK